MTNKLPTLQQSKSNIDLLKGIQTELSDLPIDKYKLYLIDRNLKRTTAKSDDSSQSRLVGERISYSVYLASIDDNLKQTFKELLSSKIESRLNREGISVQDYSPIPSESNPILRYELKGQRVAFSDVVQNQLLRATDSDPITSLLDIKGKIWAFCISVTRDGGTKIFSFTKIRESKLTTQKNKKSFSAGFFGTEEIELTELDSATELIEFDKDIDCLFIEDSFYIFGKGHFEEIVDLEAEYSKHANDVIQHLEGTGLIAGLENIHRLCKSNSDLIKKLYKISKTDNYRNLITSEGLIEIKAAVERKGIPLRFNEEGKIEIETDSDIEEFVKVLAGYYLEEIVTHKLCGSFSRIELE